MMSMSRSRAGRLAAVALAAALTVTACSGGDDMSADPTGVEQTTSQETAPADDAATPTEAVEAGEEGTAEDSTDAPSDDADPDEAESAAEAGIDRAALGDPVATFETSATFKDDPEATLSYEVFPLRRDGELLTFVARLTLNSEESGQTSLSVVMPASANYSIPVTLTDSVNLRSHAIVEADGSRLSSEPISIRIGGGQSRYVHAVFAAPPADVETMTVLFEGLPSFTVPVQ